MANTIDKYCANTANSSLNGNLLNHKYGMMSSTISNDRSSDVMRNSNNNNFEEEFPRQMTQPQSNLPESTITPPNTPAFQNNRRGNAFFATPSLL